MPNLDHNDSTDYQSLPPPGVNDFLRGQTPIPTVSISMPRSTHVAQEKARNGLHSPWTPYDNNFEIDNTFVGNNNETHQDSNAKGAVGMDGEWHQFRPSQSLQIGKVPRTARGMNSQDETEISASYTGPIHRSHSQVNAEGGPFEHQLPTQLLLGNLQLQSPS
jgi:hypothetical protein